MIEIALAYVAILLHEARYAYKRVLPDMVHRSSHDGLPIFLFCPHKAVVLGHAKLGTLLIACDCGRVVLRQPGYRPDFSHADLVKWLMRHQRAT